MRVVNTEELRRLREEHPNMLLVDTQSPKEFESYHIPGSINLPNQRDDFVSKIEQSAGVRERLIVLYAASREDDSSARGAQKLDEAGFTRVYVYQAATEEWADLAPSGDTAA